MSDSLGGAFPNKVCATLEIRACRVTIVQPPAGKIIYSNSRVHGNRTLYAESGSYTTINYYHIKLLFPGCLPRREVEEGILGALIIVTTYYYTFLHQLMLHCYYNHAIITVGCSLLMLQDRLKMLVFDRPSFSPLTLAFCSSVHYIASPFPLIPNA